MANRRGSARHHSLGHSLQGLPRIPLGQGLGQLGNKAFVIFVVAGGGQLFERRFGVPGRATATLDGQADGGGLQAQAGVRVYLRQEVGEQVTVEEAELEVLSARKDSRQHFLRVCRGQYEHDVARGLFQRFQQRAGGVAGELVDFVDDVDLPSARGPQSDPGQQLPHFFQLAV